jgi:L-fuconolactonase
LVSEVPSNEENRRLLALAGAHDYVLGVVCAVDLADAGLGALLEEFQGHRKFRGVSSRSAHVAGCAELERRELTLDIAPDFAAVERIAEAFPRLRIAIDHVGRAGRMAGSLESLQALARYPNVYAKISGLTTDTPGQWTAGQFAPWVRAALSAFGAERVMYGSDWPSYLPDGTWKEALAAFTQAIGAQTIETREQLLGGTARRFYRLGDEV